MTWTLRSNNFGAGTLAVGLTATALVLAAWQSADQLSPVLWKGALLHPSPANIAELIFHFSTAPRLVVAVLSGAALAAAGTIFQHVLRNPLASPVTLGVSSGAQLAVVAATVFAPASLGAWPVATALAGATISIAAVLVIAAARHFSSLAVVLSGLSVGLFCGALGHVLKLFNQEYLAAIFLWGAGSLDQGDWSAVRALVPRLAVLAVAAAFLLRPMRLLGLADESAKGLGVALTVFRLAALGVGVGFAAVVTAAVGMIGFVEIAAPLIARLAGARGFGSRIAIAPVIGAALLVIVDSAVQMLDHRFGVDLPTGAATAFLGAPLLLWLLPRMRTDAGPASTIDDTGSAPATAPLRLLLTIAAFSIAALLLALVVGRTGLGWSLVLPDTWQAIAPWRVPRTAEAFAAGAMLATAGTLLQRVTGNPLASPEILGLGAAVMTGLALALLLIPQPSGPFLMLMGSAGAMALLAFLMWGGLRSRFAPDQLLLTGVALTAALDAVVIAFLAVGDARSGLLLDWMAGSTAAATAGSAYAVLGTAVLLIPLTLGFARTLDLLPLGAAVAGGLGVALTSARAGIMALSALLTAAAVLTVGPLTFVGLVGPHLARRLGLVRTAVQLPGAALIGGLVMVLADWLGRIALAPFELPAGLVASLIGCPYLIVQLRRWA